MGLKIGPPSSLMVISYRPALVTIGLSLTVLAVLQFVTNRQTDGWTELV